MYWSPERHADLLEGYWGSADAALRQLEKLWKHYANRPPASSMPHWRLVIEILKGKENENELPKSVYGANGDGAWMSHFADCPGANTHTRGKK